VTEETDALRMAAPAEPTDAQGDESKCAECHARPVTTATKPYCRLCYDLDHTLHSEEEIKHTMLALTYWQLGRLPDVRRDLEGLYDRIGIRMEAQAPGERLTPTRDDLALVESFVRRWRLPLARGASDVAYSLRLRATYRRAKDRMPPDLGALYAPRAEPALRAELPDSHRIAARVKGEAVEGALIVPYIPGPFEYDPTTMSPRQLQEHADREAKRVHRSIVEQGVTARAGAQHRGWRQLPARWFEPGTMDRTAARLARRMAGHTWEQIERAEARAGQRSIRESVEEWAAVLGIDLQPNA
jgi:hypothetical protein